MNKSRLDSGEELNDFLSSRDQFDINPLKMPVSLAGSSAWDEMDIDKRNRILGGMLRNTLRRSIKKVPLYSQSPLWANINLEDIVDIRDLSELPPISKDSVPGTGSPERPGIRGFRERVIENPDVLIPENINEVIEMQESANPDNKQILDKYCGRKILEFGSGGSQGKSTITKLSYLTVETESWALARALQKNGFRQGMSVSCFYNDTHKGGLQLERAADILDMKFHSKRKIFTELAKDSTFGSAVINFQQAQSDEQRKKYEADVREAIRYYIKSNGIEIIESVQPPKEFLHNNAKGNALAFMTIYEEDPAAFRSVKHAFLTGFSVPKETYNVLRDDGIAVSTTWGSTEAMALATYPEKAGWSDVNRLIATPFPTVGVVAWYQERDCAKPILKEVDIGLEGVLYVTGLLGGGSTYINYRIGDRATKTDIGFEGINRSMRIDIGGSCAADALGI
ncbi:hypothetical protein J4229_01405 [Candidatus Pacearchaeota archaeon]|nr:hypothetical protein [Candidatus Pacearchaeota archaeon]